MGGRAPLDSTTIPDDLYPAQDLPTKLRIGVPRHLLESGIDEEVRTALDATLEKLKERGHTLIDIKLPMSAYALAAYYVIMPAEVSTNLARLDGIRYGLAKRGETLLDDYVGSRTAAFGPEPRRRLLLGTYVLSSGYIDAYYRKARTARGVLRAEYEQAFERCDIVAFPTTPAPAFRFGEKSDPVSMYL